MSLVIWINGAFSAGKSTVADALNDLLRPSFVLDPEDVGTLVCRVLPREIQMPDYQDIPLWRLVTRESVIAAARGFDGAVVVPMTVVEHFDELIGSLREQVRVEHFTLLASAETLEARHSQRSDGDDWARSQWPRCRQLAADRFARHVTIDGRDPREIAIEIAELAGAT